MAGPRHWGIQAFCRASGHTQSRRQFFASKSSNEDLIYPSARSLNHQDLASFLDYAKRIKLDPKSTVYVGTHYEYTVAAALATYGFKLVRVGGAADKGIDLVGVWNLPSGPPGGIRVLVQCKGGAQRVSPQLVRELEGSFLGAPVGWRGAGVLAFLASDKTATKGGRDALGLSRWPMGCISCSKDGVVRQMTWNRQADENGLLGIGVAMKFKDGAGDGDDPQLMLTWRDKPLDLDSSTQRE